MKKTLGGLFLAPIRDIKGVINATPEVAQGCSQLRSLAFGGAHRNGVVAFELRCILHVMTEACEFRPPFGDGVARGKPGQLLKGDRQRIGVVLQAQEL